MNRINNIKTPMSRINRMNNAMKGTAKSILTKLKSATTMVRSRQVGPSNEDDNFQRADDAPISV